MTEFKDALDWIEREIRSRESFARMADPKTAHDQQRQIRHMHIAKRALRIADRLMQEPSEEVLRLGYIGYNPGGIYHPQAPINEMSSALKAMRDQMLKEIDE